MPGRSSDGQEVGKSEGVAVGILENCRLPHFIKDGQSDISRKNVFVFERALVRLGGRKPGTRVKGARGEGPPPLSQEKRRTLHVSVKSELQQREDREED